MVLHTRAVDKQQAAALGMLTSQAGLAALQAVLALQPLPKPGVGAAPQGFWRALLARVKELPPIFGNFSTLGSPAVQSLSVAEPPAAERVSVASHAAPNVASIEASITRAAASVLGTEQLDPRQPLAAQGLDSLASLELRQRIQAGLESL